MVFVWTAEIGCFARLDVAVLGYADTVLPRKPVVGLSHILDGSLVLEPLNRGQIEACFVLHGTLGNADAVGITQQGNRPGFRLPEAFEAAS